MHPTRKSNRSFRLTVFSPLLLALAVVLWAPNAWGQRRDGTEIETVQFKSTLVGQTLPYDVLLPPGYASSNRRYPVLYLLHGLFGRYDDWLTRTNLADYAANYEVIIITPEGHDNWYTDSATVATDRYESYILRELIPDVDERFRSIKDRRGRGVAGLSMGGYGALKYAFKYPDQFAFAASISGALDPAVRTDEHPGHIWNILRPSISAVYGSAGSQTREANDLHKIARSLSVSQVASLPFIYFDCGTEDGFLDTNRELATILLEKKIPHQYRQLPGGHNWGYWDTQIREVLRLFAQRMADIGAERR